MEETDRKILELLSRDGRMSYTEIGKQTGLSTSAAQQRVRRLEQREVITGYRAQIDPAALNRSLTAFIAIRPLDPSQKDDLPDRMSTLPEVVSCYSVAGDSSYLLKAAVENPLALEGLLARIRTELGVATHTTLVLSVPFEDRITL